MKEARSYGAIGWTMAALDSFDKMAECENPKGVPKFTNLLPPADHAGAVMNGHETVFFAFNFGPFQNQGRMAKTLAGAPEPPLINMGIT